MVWEVTYLLSPILLVFLTSGSWTQKIELLKAVEGHNVSVACRYPSTQRSKVKCWCLKTSERSCNILVDSLRTGMRRPQFSIQDHPEFNYFTVSMTALKVGNTGFYHCGITDSHRMITVLRSVQLLVSNANPPTTSRTSTFLASATSPAFDSPETNWTWKVIIAGVVVAILLLLGLVILVVLYLRKVRGKAKKVENEPHHIYEDFSGQKEETAGFDEQILSDEDTGGICYASLIHLNHVSPQDSVYSNIQPYLEPAPDPFLSVEYTSIAGNRLQPPKPSVLEDKPGN
ncbi:CMRF35-like molecule 7 [Nannospalax galili]|uniref:CMRF35-like molecule 7 n=1 Tax=Nannospalax galili TaxID=1026970 RepID=UPI0004ED4199|nr:CMRF35-like molecule 7 [Nannospalax galili]